jgi:hypothetical protein
VEAIGESGSIDSPYCRCWPAPPTSAPIVIFTGTY